MGPVETTKLAFRCSLVKGPLLGNIKEYEPVRSQLHEASGCSS